MISTRRTLITALLLIVAQVPAWGADAKLDKERGEIRKAASTTLKAFYKADPSLQKSVGEAAGYAVFTTYGGSLLIGGAGGQGIAKEKGKSKEIFMSLAQASAGLQVGISDTRYLFLFKDAAAFSQFVEYGWEAGASASAGAGSADADSVNAKAGAAAFTGGRMYMLTKAGVQAGGAVAGTKVWKSKELN